VPARCCVFIPNWQFGTYIKKVKVHIRTLYTSVWVKSPCRVAYVCFKPLAIKMVCTIEAPSSSTHSLNAWVPYPPYINKCNHLRPLAIKIICSIKVQLLSTRSPHKQYLQTFKNRVRLSSGGILKIRGLG
jgi:hypothetical protein